MIHARIVPDELEQQIFGLLESFVQEEGLDVTLRVAGGWVRDKLLGLQCHDMDIALDNMMGESFAFRFSSYLSSQGVVPSSVGLIQSNPDRSKHLQTATLHLLGVSVDFVNLRAESYATDSRIPETIVFGTPKEDALRRDITINSLFYNLRSRDVEDWTEAGIADLRSGLVRTPLAPKETLLDDPLRILRAVRFATRFAYTMGQDLVEAIQEPDVVKAFSDKVSRERVGIELDKMLLNANAGKSMQALAELGFLPLVFSPPPVVNVNNDGYVGSLSFFEDLALPLDELTRRLAYLCLGCLPYCEAMFENEKKKPEHAVSYIVRSSLKLSKRDIADVEQLLLPVPCICSFSKDHPNSPSRLGRLVRDLGPNWRVAFALAKCYDRALAADVDRLEKQICGLGLDNAFEMRPLLSGRDVQDLLGLEAGKPVGDALQRLLDWQYLHPTTTREDAIAFISGGRTLE